MFCSVSTNSRGRRPGGQQGGSRQGVSRLWGKVAALYPLLAGLLLCAGPARAQLSTSPASVACPAPRVPEPCVELDARRSLDPGAGPLTYRWLMGDGTTLTGPVISHCYARRGRYTVQLDVLVESTGELRPAEKTLVVDFTQEPLLDFTQSADTVRVGQPVEFDASRAQNPPCTNEQVAWDFRDGLIAGGRRVSHAFRRPGRYEVRMSLRGNGPNACPESHCVSRTVVVKE